MRKVLIIILFLLPFAGICQEMKEYKATNGVTYHNGDTVKVGTGSMPDGNFKYIQVTPPPFMPPRRSTNDLNARKSFSMSRGIIKKIKKETPFDGGEHVVLTIKTNGIGTYQIWIEEAISACEVTPCKSPAAAANTQISVADEIAKLKKLLDSGAITKEEYDKQKKKLLGE